MNEFVFQTYLITAIVVAIFTLATHVLIRNRGVTLGAGILATIIGLFIVAEFVLGGQEETAMPSMTLAISATVVIVAFAFVGGSAWIGSGNQSKPKPKPRAPSPPVAALCDATRIRLKSYKPRPEPKKRFEITEDEVWTAGFSLIAGAIVAGLLKLVLRRVPFWLLWPLGVTLAGLSWWKFCDTPSHHPRR